MDEWLAELGPEARERPEPTVRGSVVAAAAVLAVVGLGAIAIDAGSGDDGTNIVGVLLGLVTVGAGHATLVALPPKVRPAGVTLVALGTVLALGFIFDDLDAPTLPLLLLTAAYAAQWLIGPARGATTLLTLALLSAWALIIDVVSSDESSSSATVSLDDLSVPATSFTSGDETVSYVSLLIGIALLLATRALDGRRFHGLATSSLIVGDIAFVIGTFGVVASFGDDAAGSIFIILAGLVLAFVGAGGDRRLTTWLGGIGVLIGLLTLLSTIVELDDATQFGLVAIVLGAGIVLGVAFITPDAADDAAPIDTQPANAAAVNAPAPPVDAPAPPVPTAPPPPVVQTGWHADPTGRHELRWFDGRTWTANVADQGDVSTDEGV